MEINTQGCNQRVLLGNDDDDGNRQYNVRMDGWKTLEALFNCSTRRLF